MTIQIRHAGPLDLDFLETIENQADRLLIERLHPAQWEPAPTGVSRASNSGYVFIAEIDAATIAGFVHVIETGGIAHLEQLSVSPEHGRRGYGRALVDAAKTEAWRRGYRRLTLRTYADIPWNAPFYARAGFIEEEAITPFHLKLMETEARLGLSHYGRRIQMVAELEHSELLATSIRPVEAIWTS